jgi:FSR family fosmidomycin resistance protein-like MFS transporter
MVIALTGMGFYWLMARRVIVESKIDRQPDVPASREDTLRALGVLAVTLLCTGLIYQATQPALPKVFSERIGDIASGGVLGVSALVALVYLVAGGLQILAGHLADRYPLKAVYFSCFVLQAPMLMLAGSLGGTSLVVVAMIMVSINAGSLPAENSLVARYAPSHRRGLAFGLKFVLAFGISALGVKMEAVLYDLTGGFFWLFVVLGAIATVGVAAAWLLPSERRAPVPVAAE